MTQSIPPFETKDLDMTTQKAHQNEKRRRRVVAALIASFALLLAACGSEPIPISAPADGESAAAPANQAPATPVSIGESDLGQILVNDAGFSLYGFTDDVDGESACYDGCAGAWPPVLVPTAEVPAGLDPAVFSVTQRTGGTNQLKAGVWPLYLFAGDLAPGQTTGHLSGDVWFAVSPTGALIDGPAPAAVQQADDVVAGEDQSEAAEPDGDDGYGYGTENSEAAAAPAVGAAASEFGDILVDAQGLALYGFTNDADGWPTCDGGCADAWPPALVSTPDLPAGLDAALFSVVERSDGTHQLKAGEWPLYRFAGDTAAGQTTGHLSGDVWFLAGTDGVLIGAAAAQPAPAAQPAATETPAPTAVPAPTATPVPVEPTPTPDPYASDY